MSTLLTVSQKENPASAASPGRGWLVAFLSASNFPRYELLRRQTEKNGFFRSCHAVQGCSACSARRPTAASI